MKAIVVERAGGPEMLQIREIPRPEPESGWVLIRVKAFGLNRSELLTRRGASPSVRFPRVLGIECVGVVEAAPGSENLREGQKVAAVMGGMGRDFDGGYAEYALVPSSQVMPLETILPWETLAAIPETFLTAWGSLVGAMEVRPGQTLLVRGGSSSVGMAATALAKDIGLTVLSTTRAEEKIDALREGGADHVIGDSGEIAEAVRDIVPDGVDRVLELVGPATLPDSLRTVAAGGILCNSGILGGSWVWENFEPLTNIPSSVKLTVYTSESVTAANSTNVLQQIVGSIEAGRYDVNLDRAFAFEKITQAHRYMEENRAMGKLVVLVG